MSFEVTDQHGAKAIDEVSIRVTPMPILSIFPAADTIKTHAAEFTMEGIATNVDSLLTTYLRANNTTDAIPLLLIDNNQFSQLIPINKGKDPQTVRVTLKVENTFGNTNTFIKDVSFRPTVDTEAGGTISINDNVGIPNNNTCVEVGDEEVLDEVDVVIVPDDSTPKRLLSKADVDSSRLLSTPMRLMLSIW